MLDIDRAAERRRNAVNPGRAIGRTLGKAERIEFGEQRRLETARRSRGLTTCHSLQLIDELAHVPTPEQAMLRRRLERQQPGRPAVRVGLVEATQISDGRIRCVGRQV